MLGAEAKKASSQLKTDVQKMFNQLLMAGGDQLLKAYEGLTKSGVLLAGGANDIQQALTVGGQMRITFQTFERMVQASAGLLADSNMGVGKAAAMMGNIAARLKASGVDKAFQALGIDLEETGPIIAQVMKDFARSGRKLTEGDKPEVVQRTIEYAKNLALLAQLSGKTVKEEMAKRAAAQSEFGYRAKMAQLGERANVEQAQVMEGLSATTRAAVVELERFGFIKNEDVRNMAQLIPEFGDYLNSLAQDFGAGRLDIKRELELRQKMSPALQNSLKNNPLLADLAVARTKLEAPLNNFIEEYDRTMRSNAETVSSSSEVIDKRYKKGLKAALGDGGGLDSTLLFMKSIGEEFSAKFQENIIGRIEQIGGLLKSALDQAAALIKKGPGASTKVLDETVNRMEQLGMLAAAAMALSYAIKGIRSLLPGPKPAGAPTTTTTANTTTTESARTTSGPKSMTSAEMREAEKGMRNSERMRFRSEQAALRSAEAAAAQSAAQTEAELAKQVARNAKIVKYAKIATKATAVLQVGLYANDMNNIHERKNAGEIDERQANAEYTGKTVETAGGLAASFIGAKIGAAIGAGIGAWFGGVGAIPGAAVGGLLGAIFGGAVYYLTKSADWVNSTFQRASKWWQDSKITDKITGIWDRIGSSINSITGWISDKFNLDSIKNMIGFGGSSSSTTKSSASSTQPVATQVMASLPAGLQAYKGGLLVALMKEGNYIALSGEGKTAFTEVFTTALKNAQGGAGALGTTNYSTAFYKPKLDPKGKPVTEADFAEIGKGDPVVYALGKLTKIAAESADDMRSLAVKMGASLDTQSDSKRYLRTMTNAFR
jgi:hypothetical protein